MQGRNIVVYTSRQLKQAERNYPTHDLELCKARYAVLFQIRTFPPEPEEEAHIGPTTTYDEVIYPGFQHDITTLQIQGYNISYNRHTTALNIIHQQNTYAWVQATNRCLVAKVKQTIPVTAWVQALRRGPLASRRRVSMKASKNRVATRF